MPTQSDQILLLLLTRINPSPSNSLSLTKTHCSSVRPLVSCRGLFCSFGVFDVIRNIPFHYVPTVSTLSALSVVYVINCKNSISWFQVNWSSYAFNKLFVKATDPATVNPNVTADSRGELTKRFISWISDSNQTHNNMNHILMQIAINDKSQTQCLCLVCRNTVQSTIAQARRTRTEIKWNFELAPLLYRLSGMAVVPQLLQLSVSHRLHW